MIKHLYLSAHILAVIVSFMSFVIGPAAALDQPKPDLAKSLVGTWRIVSYSNTDLETKEVTFPLGEHPKGYLQYSPGGHLVVFFSSGNTSSAKPPFTDADKVTFYNSFDAYCGTYTIQGNVVTHHIIAAWRPDWVGDQIRYVELHGTTLQIRSQTNHSLATGRPYFSSLTWEREE